MNGGLYEIYKKTKRLIKMFDDSNGDNPHICQDWITVIKIFDELEPGYAKRYDRENVFFTPEQIDHICYQIGEWYLAMKPLLEGQHNLGHMKEKLKIMICGE